MNWELKQLEQSTSNFYGLPQGPLSLWLHVSWTLFMMTQGSKAHASTDQDHQVKALSLFLI